MVGKLMQIWKNNKIYLYAVILELHLKQKIVIKIAYHHCFNFNGYAT